jgi:hypothetical protein
MRRQPNSKLATIETQAMPSRSSIVSVYYEFVKRPFYVVVQSHMRDGHTRFDMYQPERLTELVLSALEHVTAGQRELLDRMCSLDASDKAASSHRSRRYVAKRQVDLYPSESLHLENKSVEYKGYWIGTNADKTQASSIIHLACRAADVPYETVRKLALPTRGA